MKKLVEKINSCIINNEVVNIEIVMQDGIIATNNTFIPDLVEEYDNYIVIYAQTDIYKITGDVEDNGDGVYEIKNDIVKVKFEF